MAESVRLAAVDACARRARRAGHTAAVCEKASGADTYGFEIDIADASLYIELAQKSSSCGARRDRRAAHAFDVCVPLAILAGNAKSYEQLSCSGAHGRSRRAGHSEKVSKEMFCTNNDEIFEGTFVSDTCTKCTKSQSVTSNLSASQTVLDSWHRMCCLHQITSSDDFT